MSNVLMPLVRSLVWGGVLSLVVAASEFFALMAYLGWRGKIEGKHLTGVLTYFAFNGAIGLSLGLVCGLFWLFVSRTAWRRRMEPAQMRAWEGGLLAGLFFFFISVGVVVYHAKALLKIRVPYPINLGVFLGLFLISVALVLSVKSAALALGRKKRARATVAGALATLLAVTLCSVLYWQYASSSLRLITRAVEAAKLDGDSSMERPNVLLVTVDTLRADHLSSYGYKKIRTRNIDRLANEGVLFEQMIAQSSWTRPSFGSIWSSLYGSQHRANLEAQDGVNVFDRGLGKNVPTIGELFSDAGYVTAGLNTNIHTTSSYSFDRGFQLFLDFLPLNPLRYSTLYNALINVAPASNAKLGLGFRYIPAEKVYRVFTKVVEKLQDEKKPFFLWVHFMDPHLPYYSHGETPVIGRSHYTVKQLFEDFVEFSVVREKLVELYDGEIRYVDNYIGEILDDLRSRKLFNNTIIVLTSDHGEELFDHGGKNVSSRSHLKLYNRGYDHGHTMYDELIRIPLIMKLPHSRYANVKVESVVQHIDLLPTLLAAAGVAVDRDRSGFEGINVLTYLDGKGPFPDRYVKSEYLLYGPEVKQIRTENYKLIYHTYDGTVEFYNIAQDPHEQRNLGANDGGSYRAMFSALQGWMARMEDAARMAGLSEPIRKKADRNRREALMKKLKALGYVQ
ncbi:MAG: sulfatase-like hydrolase/transferase [Candidatus Binatia bacterium]